jgi:hypothetical protein
MMTSMIFQSLGIYTNLSVMGVSEISWLLSATTTSDNHRFRHFAISHSTLLQIIFCLTTYHCTLVIHYCEVETLKFVKKRLRSLLRCDRVKNHVCLSPSRVCRSGVSVLESYTTPTYHMQVILTVPTAPHNFVPVDNAYSINHF